MSRVKSATRSDCRDGLGSDAGCGGARWGAFMGIAGRDADLEAQAGLLDHRFGEEGANSTIVA